MSGKVTIPTTGRSTTDGIAQVNSASVNPHNGRRLALGLSSSKARQLWTIVLGLSEERYFYKREVRERDTGGCERDIWKPPRVDDDRKGPNDDGPHLVNITGVL